MTTWKPLSEQRLSQTEQGDWTFVQPEEYCQLLLSWRKLVRVDERGSDVCGLMDLQSGQRYLIERRRLHQD